MGFADAIWGVKGALAIDVEKPWILRSLGTYAWEKKPGHGWGGALLVRLIVSDILGGQGTK